MVTWMQIMDEVRRLRARTERGETLGDEDARKIVAMVIDFHQGAVATLPIASRPGSQPAMQSKKPSSRAS